jgi:thioredoxin
VYVPADMADTITESTFQQEVLESEGPVLVDFWAEWCGPCHAVAPILDQIAAERSELRLVKVNIDEEPELARRFGIMSIPTMILFEGGEQKAAALGAQPKGMLEKSLGLAQAEADAQS